MNNPLVQPDPGLFLWTILTFLVLFGLLARFAWRPLVDMLDRREAGIRNALDGAEKAREELNNLQEESQQLLAKARTEAQSMIAASRKQGETIKEEIIQDARVKVGSILEASERQIQAEKQKAIRDIRDEVVDISIALASKLLERNISAEDNHSIIKQSLERIRSTRF